MKNTNLTAIILCGGKGLRLRPLTNDMPKPLIPINKTPMLGIIIDHLKSYEINDFMITTGYKSEKIDSFMKGYAELINYKTINSGDVDILSRIKDALKNFNNDFILCYGDTISDINIDNLVSFHEKYPEDIIISSYKVKLPFGIMEIDQSKNVSSFKEKPILDAEMNIGYYYFPKSSFKDINEGQDIVSLLQKFIQLKKLKCFKHDGVHITINTLAELETAKNNLSEIMSKD